jgi:IS5 family transposase
MLPRLSEIEKVGNQKSLFEQRLDDMLNRNHPLLLLANKIQWQNFDKKFEVLFHQRKGKPACSTRLVVGLLYLKHTYNLSDELVIERMKENPYWQYFCGYQFFQIETPCTSTVLVKWRKKMGEEGMEFLLQETLVQAMEAKLLKPKDLENVVVDTTVQEKNIAFPTDAKLLNRARESLVRVAKKDGIQLKQTFVKEGKFQLIKYAGYSHAKQYNRAKKPLKRLKVILGKVIREIERNCAKPGENLSKYLQLAKKICSQKKSSKDKIYSVHEPEVECISKGKAHKRYEFGCKVSVMTTNRSNWIVAAKAHHGRPYDGHTIPTILNQAKKIIGKFPSNVFADRGYRGSEPPPGVTVYLSGQKRGVDKKKKKLLKRRSAVEPIIGHMKRGNRLGRNFLKGIHGDQNNAILAAAGRNMAKLLAAFLCSDSIWNFLHNFVSLCGLFSSILS